MAEPAHETTKLRIMDGVLQQLWMIPEQDGPTRTEWRDVPNMTHYWDNETERDNG